MSQEKVKVLVCGASGFIGGNVLTHFARDKRFELFAVFHKTAIDQERFRNCKFKILHADLTNSADVTRVLKGKDVVIQAAATTSGAHDIINRPYHHVTDNAVMNSLLLRAAFEQKIKHFIFFSCTTMYPNSKKALRETDFDHEIVSKYFGVGWTKVYVEKMCEFYSRIGTTKFTVIRHSNIYGPYDKYDLKRSHVFGATMTKVMTAQDEKLIVWGDGSDERDLLHVDDLLRFIDCALRRQKSNFELVNVGLGKSISVRELVKEIISASGRRLKVIYDTSKPSINYKLAINIDRARKVFGWKPTISLKEGIRRTLAWYRDYFDISRD